MRTLTFIFALSIAAASEPADRPDVAVVKGTFAIKERPKQANAILLYCGVVERALQQNGAPYSLLSEQDVADGKLAGFKLAVFPYNTGIPGTQ